MFALSRMAFSDEEIRINTARTITSVRNSVSFLHVFAVLFALIGLSSNTARLHAQQPNPSKPPISFVSKPPTEASVGKEYMYAPRTEQTVASLLPPTFILLAAPQGMTVDPRTGIVRWTPRERGTVKVALRASLGGTTATGDMTATQEYEIRVGDASQTTPRPEPINFKPTLYFITQPATRAFAGVTFEYRALAMVACPVCLPAAPRADGSQPNISYKLEQAPSGMTIDSSTGFVRWTPLATGTVAVAIRATFHSTTGTVSDSSTTMLTAVQNFRLQVTSLDSVRLAFLSSPRLEAVTGRELVYQAFAAIYGTDANSNPSRPLQGSQGVSVGSNGDVSILPINILPIPFPIPNQGQNILRYELVSAPEGMVIDATTGTVRWRPGLTSAPGSVTASIRASFIARPTISTTQTLTIGVRQREQVAVQFVTQPSREANVGREYRYNAFATYDLSLFGVNPVRPVFPDSGRPTLPPAPVQYLTYSLTQAPNGMTIDATRGTITWTPRDTASAVQVMVRAVVTTNATLSSTQTFSIRVRTAPPVTLRFVSRPPSQAETGREFTHQVQAVASNSVTILPFPLPTEPSYPQDVRYSLTQSPSGMMIDSLKGLIRWTARDTGTVNVTVRATLMSGPNTVTTATQTFTLRVIPGPCATIQGRVRYADGSVVVSGTVQVLDAANPQRSSIVGSSVVRNGSYSIALRPGRYTLMAFGDFVSQTTAAIEVKCGDSLSRNFTVERQPATKFYLVSGKVTKQEDGKPVRAMVEFVQELANPLTKPAQRVYNATTNEDGSYVVSLPSDMAFTARATSLDRSLLLATVYYNGTPNGTTEATNATQIRLTGDLTMNFALPRQRTAKTVASSNAGSTASADDALSGTSFAFTTNSAQNLSIAPNPAANAATVQLPAFSGTARLLVMNTLGSTVLSVELVGGQSAYSLDVSNWSAGAYIVRMVGDNISATTRMTVTK